VISIAAKNSRNQACSSNFEAVRALRERIVEECEAVLRGEEGTWILTQVVDGQSLDAKEAALVKLRNILLSAIAQVVFNETGYEGSRRPCSCGNRAKYMKDEGKTYVTLVGEVRIGRATYRCMWCGNVTRPLDERLNLPSGQFSLAVQRLASMLGASVPFARASEVLDATTGVSMSARHLEEVTEWVGEQIGECLRQETEAAREANVSNPESADVLVVAVDGGMIHTREEGWKETKVGAIQALQREDDRTLRRGPISYTAVLGSVGPFRDALWSEVLRRGERGREETVVLGDGAPWIWNLADEILPGAVQILDWYHLSEHVHETKRVLSQKKDWADRVLENIWEQKIDTAIEAIEQTSTKNQAERDALDSLVRYINTNRRRMVYKTYKERGYPIGSGVVESGCKQIIQARHKQAGMRWNRDNAQKMLNLAVFIRSDRWQEFWRTQGAA